LISQEVAARIHGSRKTKATALPGSGSQIWWWQENKS